MPKAQTKILVHTCCTACASHVFSELSKAGFKVIAFYFHPEIDAEEEYDKRLADLRTYCEDTNTDLVEMPFENSELFKMTGPLRDKTSMKYISDKDRYQRRRCQLCNYLLMQKTIEQAKKQKIKFFTTTLLCSPYKDHDTIVEVSNEKALDYGLSFYYQDFRKGYWMGRNYARNHHIYISSFCGCQESLKEKRLE